MRPAARVAITTAVFLVLFATAFTGSWFRDEFYYLACSRRMDWGYVDHPPLCVAILWLVRHTLGDSLVALRSIAALFTAASVWLTGSIARRFGAGAFGEALAMVAAAVAPAMLAVGTFYSMNVFDLFFWTLAVRLTIEVVDRPTDRGWVALGVVLGLGLLNKISMLWLGAGLAGGLLLTPAPRVAADPRPVDRRRHRRPLLCATRPLAGAIRLADGRVRARGEPRQDADEHAAVVRRRPGDEHAAADAPGVGSRPARAPRRRASAPLAPPRHRVPRRRRHPDCEPDQPQRLPDAWLSDAARRGRGVVGVGHSPSCGKSGVPCRAR